MMRRSALPLWWLTMAAALLLHARPPSGTPPLLRLRAALPTCREEGDEISFGDLQVRGVLASRLLEENFKVATPIQSAAMMPIHRGENAVLHAETGSGKTLAYLLPLLNRLHNSPPARSNAPSWWRHRLLPWPPWAALPGSWLRCALRAVRRAAQAAVGACGAALRPGSGADVSGGSARWASPTLTRTRTRRQVGPTSCSSWYRRASSRCRSARSSSSCGHGTVHGACACSVAPSPRRHSTRSCRPP